MKEKKGLAHHWRGSHNSRHLKQRVTSHPHSRRTEITVRMHVCLLACSLACVQLACFSILTQFRTLCLGNGSTTSVNLSETIPHRHSYRLTRYRQPLTEALLPGNSTDCVKLTMKAHHPRHVPGKDCRLECARVLS